MAYVVRVSDDEQGFADEYVFGPFRNRQNAQRFADRVNRRIQAPDTIRAGVDYVMKPRLGELEVAGWFDAPEPEENPYELGGKRV